MHQMQAKHWVQSRSAVHTSGKVPRSLLRLSVLLHVTADLANILWFDRVRSTLLQPISYMFNHCLAGLVCPKQLSAFFFNLIRSQFLAHLHIKFRSISCVCCVSIFMPHLTLPICNMHGLIVAKQGDLRLEYTFKQEHN